MRATFNSWSYSRFTCATHWSMYSESKDATFGHRASGNVDVPDTECSTTAGSEYCMQWKVSNGDERPGRLSVDCKSPVSADTWPLVTLYGKLPTSKVSGWVSSLHSEISSCPGSLTSPAAGTCHCWWCCLATATNCLSLVISTSVSSSGASGRQHARFSSCVDLFTPRRLSSSR